jgi:hypothetical protein
MPWLRAALVWMLIMLAETGNGVIREVFIAPVIGAMRARQLGVLIGCILIRHRLADGALDECPDPA